MFSALWRGRQTDRQTDRDRETHRETERDTELFVCECLYVCVYADMARENRYSENHFLSFDGNGETNKQKHSDTLSLSL